MVYTEHSEDEEGSDNEPIMCCKEAHVCGTAIESHCHAPGDTPRKGGRITAKNICCHCYIDGDLDLDDLKDVMKTHTLAGEGVPPTCRSFLKDGAMPVITRGKSNYLEAAKEKRDKKNDGKATHKRARKS